MTKGDSGCDEERRGGYRQTQTDKSQNGLRREIERRERRGGYSAGGKWYVQNSKKYMIGLDWIGGLLEISTVCP